MARQRRQRPLKAVETLTHEGENRKNIPTAEYQPVMRDEELNPVQVAYERRNRDLDPQLVWRGKDAQDWSDLIVQAPPLYIQEKVHPKVLIDDLIRHGGTSGEPSSEQIDLFADFNGLPEGTAGTEFYQHDANWSNRMILGDSLQVMASLAEREGLRGQVQCIYIDPPYGIKFNSNFQWSTTSRDVRDGKAEHITREPEQVKAFRDTWRDGIHSYLTYLRDRLTVARDLLTDSGSVFVQIGDENEHRVRSVMDEVFGEENFISLIGFAKTSGSTEDYLGQTTDHLLWYSRDKSRVKYRPMFKRKVAGEKGGTNYNRARDLTGSSQSLTRTLLNDPRISSGELRIYSLDNLTSQSAGRDKGEGAASWFGVSLAGRVHKPSISVRWKTNEQGMARLKSAGRLESTRNRLGYVRYLDDFPAVQINKPLGRRWRQFHGGQDLCCSNVADRDSALHPHGHRSGRSRSRPHMRLRHHRLRRRAVGPPLDHHRHFPRGTGSRPRPHHGRPLSLLPARGQPGGTAQGSGDHPHRAEQRPHLRASPPGLRLRAGAPHHPQVHRQQRRDRRHLEEAPGDAGASARRAEHRTRPKLGRMAGPTGSGRAVA